MKTTRKYYEIHDRPDLLRDAHSKGLILTDKSVLKREQARAKKKSEFENLKNEVGELKDKINLILDLLQKEKH